MDEVKVKIIMCMGRHQFSHKEVFSSYSNFNNARIEAIKNFAKTYNKYRTYFKIDDYDNTTMYCEGYEDVLIWEVIR